MVNKIFCLKKKEQSKSLKEPPFQGNLGIFIYKNICEESWILWIETQIKIINEYKLDLSKNKNKKTLYKQMIQFLNLPQNIINRK